MFLKLLELADDPTMTDQKWAKWLPVVEYMDRRYEANNFLDIHLTPLAKFVRKRVDDPCYL